MAPPDDDNAEPNGNGTVAPVDETGDVSRPFTLIDAETIRDLGDAPAVPLATPVPADEPLSADELREAWPVLDLDERSDGLRLLEQEDAEELFESLSAHDQMRLLLHWRPGKRRSWIRLLEPDDVADVIQEAPEDRRAELAALLDDPTRKEVQALL